MNIFVRSFLPIPVISNWLRRGKLFIVLPLILMSAAVGSTPANDFSLQDAKGQVFTLSEHKGKPIVLHFWATWCPYCKKLQPGLERLRLENKQTDLVMMAISFNEDDGATPAQSLTDRGIGMPTLILGDAVAKQYDVTGTPTTIFIDRKGDVVWVTRTSNPDDPNLVKAVGLLIQ
ncbi:TlpA disulfide reductase family protein [Shewanella sp. OMA3-2]|uniref:TlpA disulfide reductase family protein n=1 Tax=Shewanella sp. OMA3-2 TaxID=2908650 RepID=UPI001F1CF0B3|nr:TlpA disulfide reductase family protein [Shewanella sp. OMA3-2]UJF21242.1 TlpA family protein disulfide reductase [Shewanella sp. OMA3-2]